MQTSSSGVASQFFASLAEAHVNIVAIAQGSSELYISAVIPEDKVFRNQSVSRKLI